ncbi:MAG TPA: hypothetical protein VHP58_00045 [Alphaproteobacteria bacterium]|nr:hypothetical protein [Alphaproteobacteria bacterium]
MSLVKRIMAREMLLVALAAGTPAVALPIDYYGAPVKKPARHGHHKSGVPENAVPTTAGSTTQPGASGMAIMQNTVSTTTR